MSRLEPYRYSVGHDAYRHGPDERFHFPRGQCLYTEDWRLVATDLADDYYSNHDGWEEKWPVEFRIYKNDECAWKGNVTCEMEPAFYAL